MKLRIILALVVLALIAGVAYRTQEKPANTEGGSGGRRMNGGSGDKMLTVRTAPVALRDFPRVIDVPGTIDAARQVAIVAQTSGVLQQQRVQEGQTVRAGDLLFTLDAQPLRAQIDQHRAALSGAAAAEREAARLVEQLTPLNAPGYISHKEFADAQLAQESARATASGARAALHAAQLAWDQTQLRAPIAGRIGRVNVQPGSLVQANSATPLTTIIAPGALDVRASVAQQDWPQLAEARARGKVLADIFADTGNTPGTSDNTVSARGELVFVDSQIDAATGAVAIKVRLNAPPPTLLSGQGVRMRLLLGDEAGVLVIPDAALQQAQAGSYVYVVRAGRAVSQPVTALRELDGQVAVSGKLAAGELVLIEVPQRLKAGSRVKPETAARGNGARPHPHKPDSPSPHP